MKCHNDIHLYTKKTFSTCDLTNTSIDIEAFGWWRWWWRWRSRFLLREGKKKNEEMTVCFIYLFNLLTAACHHQQQCTTSNNKSIRLFKMNAFMNSLIKITKLTQINFVILITM